MQRQFCYLCATKLEPKTESSWWCQTCKYVQYENAKPCVELLLHKDGKFLISQRGIEPRKGFFDMPGGFVEREETLGEALLREAKEELDLDEGDMTPPFYLWSFNNDYPFGPETYRTVVAVFFAELISDKRLLPHDDVAGLQWITPEEVLSIKWALPFHKENIGRAQMHIAQNRPTT